MEVLSSLSEEIVPVHLTNYMRVQVRIMKKLLREPMDEKSPEMRAAIEALFPGTEAAIAVHKCPVCHGPITDFRDRLSEREYEISGMCQNCQDAVFGA